MPRKRFDALAVGDAILDIVTPPVDPGGGDRQTRVDHFGFLPGGNATNFTLAFAALGGRARFVGCVGRDWAGDILRGSYAAAGVQVRLLISRASATGMTVAITFSGGTRHLITAIGANADLGPSDVPATWLSAAAHVHRAGYWWATGLMGPPTAKLLRRARAAGATTSLDIATDPEGWTDDRRRSVLRVLPEVDVFFGNEVEITAVAGVPVLEDAIDRFRSLGVREVVVHQGDRGATAFTAAEVASEAAVHVPARNPTGCGDVFNAAYVFAFEAGRPIRERLRYANAASALHLGDPRRPYPPAASVERLIRGRRDHRRR